jgi:hypothetical protein
MNQVNILMLKMLKAVNSHTKFALLDPLRPTQMALDHLKHNCVILSPLSWLAPRLHGLGAN